MQSKVLGVEVTGELQDAVHLCPHVRTFLELGQNLTRNLLLFVRKGGGGGGREGGGKGRGEGGGGGGREGGGREGEKCEEENIIAHEKKRVNKVRSVVYKKCLQPTCNPL